MLPASSRSARRARTSPIPRRRRSAQVHPRCDTGYAARRMRRLVVPRGLVAPSPPPGVHHALRGRTQSCYGLGFSVVAPSHAMVWVSPWSHPVMLWSGFLRGRTQSCYGLGLVSCSINPPNQVLGPSSGSRPTPRQVRAGPVAVLGPVLL